MTKSSLLMLAATGGWVVSGSAATVYNETSGDLSNDSMSPTALASGTDTVIGSLDAIFSGDFSDHFLITSLLAGGTAQFDFSSTSNNLSDGIRFVFSDPAGATLYTSPNYFASSASGTTGDITVPASGQVKVSVQNVFTLEGGPIGHTWSVATNDVVPETSTVALAALGSLLAMRRNRK